MDPRQAGPDDVALVAEIAAGGFADDPVMGWVFPDPATRESALRVVFDLIARRYLAKEGLVHLLDRSCTAMWERPGPGGAAVEPAREEPQDEPSPEVAAVLTSEVVERFAVVEAALVENRPHDRPHWYLGILSTIPERQSRGLGGQIMAPVLSVCDSEGWPAYLESSNPRNLAFYFRHGFVQTGEITLADGPSLYPMWREPAGP